MHTNNAVRIKGIGLVSPIAIGFVDNINAIISGNTIFKEEKSGAYSASIDFNLKQFIRNKKAIRFMDKQTMLGCTAAALAVEDARLNHEKFNSDSWQNAMIFGSGIGESIVSFLPALKNCITETNTINYSKLGETGYRNLPPLWILQRLPNTTAGQIAIENHIKGLHYTVVNGPCNGMIAVGNAFEFIQQQRFTRCFCGASQGIIHLDAYHRMNKQQVVTDNSNGSFSFGVNSTGAFASEGGCMFILENHNGGEFNSSGKVKNECSIIGYHQRYIPNFDVISIEEKAQHYEKCIRRVIENSGLNTTNIDFIQANGCGILFIDQAEARALKNIFGGTTPVTAANALGYPLAASGAFNIAMAVMQLKEQFIAPIVKTEQFFSNELQYVKTLYSQKSTYCLETVLILFINSIFKNFEDVILSVLSSKDS